MQDFSFGKIKTQETQKEPYMLYRKDQQGEVPMERAVIRDFEYFRSMYPERLKTLQVEVEKVCDEMDYKGSPMYDEFPDRVLMEQMRKKVEEQTKESDQEPLTETAFAAETENYLPEQTEPRGCREWEMNELPVMQAEETRGDFRGSACCPWGSPTPPPPWPWRPVPPPRPWNPCPWGMSCPWRPAPPPPPRPWNPSRPWERPRPWGEEMSRPRIQSADVIDVLLFNEMQRRRCGRGNCR